MEFLHASEQIDGAGEIVLVVEDWFFDGFGYGFEAGKMHDEVETIVFENPFDGAVVDKVGMVKNWGFASDFFDVFESGSPTVDEIVYNRDFVICFQ